jgi:hypothetical protein
MPPEPKAEPAVDAKAAAWPCTMGSSAAYWRRTSLSRVRKRGFSVRESGVGGIFVVVPTESLWEGGSVGRRVRICEVVGDDGLGKTYWAR